MLKKPYLEVLETNQPFIRIKLKDKSKMNWEMWRDNIKLETARMEIVSDGDQNSHWIIEPGITSVTIKTNIEM